MRPSRSWTVPLLTIVGGGAISIGAWLPWMSYFAGLYPLRGVIGVNGRVLLAVGIAVVVGGLVLARQQHETVRGARSRRILKRSFAALGALVMVAASWLVVGVRELTRPHASNAMFAPRPGVGLFVVLAGGALLAIVSLLPDTSRSEAATALERRNHRGHLASSFHQS
jgi:hypothetical protein